MALFQYDEIYNAASTIIPGTSPSPSNPGDLGMSNPGIESYNWGEPEKFALEQVAGLAGFLNNGESPDNVFQKGSQGNGFVTGKYTVKPWTEDKSHLQIREGMIVFCMTELDSQFRDLANMAALPRLNQLLYQQHLMFQKYANVPEIREAQESLEAYSEKDIEAELSMRRKRLRSPNTAMNVAIRSLNKAVMKYQTATGIMRTWNFLGGIRVVSEATTGADMFSADGSDNCGSFTVTVGKRCMLANVWGSEEFGQNVNVGARLYLILRRLQLPDGTYGAFQLYPYATRYYPKPPRALCAYQNPYTGTWEEGKVIFVGTVTRGADKDCTMGIREAASGLGINTNASSAFEATPKAGELEVQIGI